MAVMTNTNLSPWARLLVVILVHHDDKKRGCFPGRDLLAAELGTSITTTDRAITELVTAGIVTKKRQGRSHTNRYELTHESPPVTSHVTDESPPVASHMKDESSPVATLDSSPVTTHVERLLLTEKEPDELDTSSLRSDVTPAKIRTPVKTLLPDEWDPTPAMIEKAAARHGLTLAAIADKTQGFRDWANSNAHRKADWDATWRNFMAPSRFDAPMPGARAPNGYHKPTYTERARSLADLADDLEAKGL